MKDGSLSDENAEEDDEEDSFMTLRKSAAFTLTEFSRNYADVVFLKIQPHLQKLLQSESADLEEAAILALGCISDQDCSYGGIEPHLETLVPYLIQKLEHSSKDVRSTSCWTLSKFSEWIGCEPNELDDQQSDN